MNSTPQTADAVDVSRASELTGLSKKAIRRRLERGTLDSVKVGGRRMIPVAELSRRGLLRAGAEARPAGVEAHGPEPPSVEARTPAEAETPAEPAPAASPPPSRAEAAPSAAREPSPPPPREPATRPMEPSAPGEPRSAEPEQASRAAATPRPAAPGAAGMAPSAEQPATYPAATPPVSPAPGAGRNGAATPPGGYYASPQGFYPARGGWYYWYEYPAVRWLAALLAVGLVALLAWLLFIRPDDGAGPTAARPGGGPVATTESELVALSQELRQPVYWAGDLPGTRLELTQSSNGWPYLRYLTDDTPIGDPSPDFLTVGTYPTPDAFENLRAYADRADARMSRIDDGGLVVTVPGSPTSVYFAYPDEDVQVEVYDPESGRALNLVKTGVIRPVTATIQTTQ